MLETASNHLRRLDLNVRVEHGAMELPFEELLVLKLVQYIFVQKHLFPLPLFYKLTKFG